MLVLAKSWDNNYSLSIVDGMKKYYHIYACLFVYISNFKWVFTEFFNSLHIRESWVEKLYSCFKYISSSKVIKTAGSLEREVYKQRVSF